MIFKAKHPYENRKTYYTYIGKMPYNKNTNIHLINTDDGHTTTLETILKIKLEKDKEPK